MKLHYLNEPVISVPWHPTRRTANRPSIQEDRTVSCECRCHGRQAESPTPSPMPTNQSTCTVYGGRLGPIVQLKDQPNITVHEILKPLYSIVKLPLGRTRMGSADIQRALELSPLIVIRRKDGYRALNHGVLVNHLMMNPDKRPSLYYVREVMIKPNTIDFFKLLYDIHLTLFTLLRCENSAKVEEYVEALSKIAQNYDRAENALKKILKSKEATVQAIAKFMGSTYRGGKR